MHATHKLRLSAVMVALGCQIAAVAGTTFSTPVMRIEATAGPLTGSFEIPMANPAGPDVFTAFQLAPIDILDTNTNAFIARLNSANVVIQTGDTKRLNLGFVLEAGDADTDISISSSVLAFDPLADAMGRATASLTVTDQNGDGATLTGLGAGGMSYRTMYNGGVLFADGINSVVTGPGGSMSGDVNVPAAGELPIGVPVSEMNATLDFRVTAGDSASGTTNYLILPEPASVLLMLGLGLSALRRR